MQRIAIAFLLGAVLLSCSDGRHVIPGTQSGPGPGPGPGPSGTGILGNWFQNCALIDSAYEKVSLTVAASTYQSTIDMYSDNGCATRVMRQQWSGTYTGGGAVTGGTAIDWNPTALTITATHDDYVGIFNALSFCGYADWQKDIPRDCTSQATKIYQIYGVNGNTAYLGKIDDSHDASSNSQRPVQLLTSAPYARQ